QQTASNRLAIDWADSTSNVGMPLGYSLRSSSVEGGTSYVAGPRSGKPVGWNRVPATGFKAASIRMRGSSFSFGKSIGMSHSMVDVQVIATGGARTCRARRVREFGDNGNRQ